jgi:hypothetical protein
MSRGRGGAALLLAVLLSTSGVLLAHGLLVLARRELAAARIAARVARAERLGVLGARRALEPGPPPLDGLPPGSAQRLDSGVVAGAVWRSFLRQLAPEIWLAEGEALDGPVRRRLAWPAWRLDPGARIDALGAVVTTGGTSPLEGSGRVETLQFDAAPAVPPPDGCPPDTAAAVAFPAWRADLDSLSVRLGRLRLDGLLDLAGDTVFGEGTPAARELFGDCVDGPWNWGDPGGAGRPCGSRLVHVALEPAVVVQGGAGQGVLVGRGDVTLVDTRFYGVLLVEGRVWLKSGAVVTGMVVARGGVRIDDGAGVVGSRCWAREALGVRSLAALQAVTGTGWIRFDR